MLKKLWGIICNLFAGSDTNQPMYKQLIVNEYKSVAYALHRAHNLQQLLEVRNRIKGFQQLLVESRLEYWGKSYVTDLNKLWNAKFQYWKEKARNY